MSIVAGGGAEVEGQGASLPALWRGGCSCVRAAISQPRLPPLSSATKSMHDNVDFVALVFGATCVSSFESVRDVFSCGHERRCFGRI